MKAAVFDIETTGLDAIGSGALLCAVIKPLDKASITLRGDDMHARPGSEKRLVQAVNDALSQYDLLIGHNIAGFDLPWLRSRAVYFGLPDPARPFVYDTLKAFRRLGYKTVPNRIGKPSAGLSHAVDFFGIEQDKTSVMPREWWASVWGKPTERQRAMDDIVSHCYSDVRMTEKLYWQLLRADHAASIRRQR